MSHGGASHANETSQIHEGDTVAFRKGGKLHQGVVEEVDHATGRVRRESKPFAWFIHDITFYCILPVFLLMECKHIHDMYRYRAGD